MGERAVQAESLGKRYGDTWALENLSLEVERGQIVGLVGTNGSGKTTTLRLLAGLTAPTMGSVRMLGQKIDQVRARVGVVLEEPAFYPHLSPLEHLEIALSYAGSRLSRIERLALLDRLSIPKPTGPVRHLSLGARRRLALAVALAKRPELLLLDEPANGLDLDGLDLLRLLLRDLSSDGVAVILSSHQWDQVEQLVDQVVALHRGKLLYAGSKQGLAGEGALSDAYRALTREG